MNSEDFINIEKQLQIDIPEYYKSTILNYPFKTCDDEDFIEDNIVNNTEWLISTNITLRSEGFFGQDWPTYFFTIGHDGCLILDFVMR